MKDNPFSQVARILAALLCLASIFPTRTTAAEGDDEGWIPLFDGRTLDGWKAAENPGTFSVADGLIVAHGKRAHLFYVGPVANHDFQNFELSLEINTGPKANGGVYFHTEYQEEGWPRKGYEVQVNNTQARTRRTGSLYAVEDVDETPAKDGEWFTMAIRVVGKQIVTTINGQVIVDYVEPPSPERSRDMKRRLLSSGTFALQAHDADSVLRFRNIRVRLLPANVY